MKEQKKGIPGVRKTGGQKEEERMEGTQKRKIWLEIQGVQGSLC